MKLIISNITIAGEPIKHGEKLEDYLTERLASANIKCVFKKVKETLEIIPSVDKKLFLASKKNYIPLKLGDPRAKELGRDYLDSERLSERQFAFLKKVFSEHLDLIHVSCDIHLWVTSGTSESYVVIRDKTCNYISEWTTPTSFPLERN